MKPKRKTEERKSWIVTVKCEVTKEVVTSECTREEALNNPWEYAVDEQETSQEDWKVTKIKENS